MATRYVLSTDASKRGERASIGVVLRQMTTERGSEVVAYISHEINPVSIAAAEYRALYEGLRLVASYKPKELQVFTDADYIPKQVTQEKRPKNSEIADAWSQAVAQIAKLKDAGTAFSISWVPREMNWEADQRAADGFFARWVDWLRAATNGALERRARRRVRDAPPPQALRCSSRPRG